MFLLSAQFILCMWQHVAESESILQTAVCLTDQHCLFACLHPSVISCPTLTLQDPGGMDYLSFFMPCVRRAPSPVAGPRQSLINNTDGDWDEDGCETLCKDLSYMASPQGFLVFAVLWL